jgi:hypothetical protein
MSCSPSNSSVSSSSSSILGTTETNNGKKRRVQFKQRKKRSTGPVDDIFDPNNNVTSPDARSAPSTEIGTNNDSLSLSTSSVAPPSSPTGAIIDKADVPAPKAPPKAKPKLRKPPVSAATALYMKNKANKTKRTGTTTSDAVPTNVKKQRVPPTPKVPYVKKVALKTGIVKPTQITEHHNILNVSVCFDLSVSYGKEIHLHIGVIPPEAIVTMHGKEYIYGAIAHHRDPGKYKIEFEHSHLKSCTMDTGGTIYGMNLAANLRNDRMVQENLVEAGAERNAYENFIHAHDKSDNGEQALDSDEDCSDEDDDQVPDNESSAGYNYLPRKTRFQFDPLTQMTEDCSNSGHEEKSSFITWRRDIKLPANPKKSALGKTHLKPEAHKLFDSPLNSFLAFLPIPIWETMVKESNRFCEQQRKLNSNHWISGHPWSHDLTLQELMTFMSILIEMTLHPTPGRAYTYMWQHPTLYPFTTAMSVTRFRQIRCIIHLCDNESDSNKTKDADRLSKIRPLLQILKETLPIYLNIGDDLALDEASVPSKSKFGRFLILYNPMKPGGKYHYRFYFVCDSDNYNLLRFTMHTKNNSDLADGFNVSILDLDSGEYMNGPPSQMVPPGAEPHVSTNQGYDESKSEEKVVDNTVLDEEEGKITTLMLDLLKPYHGSFRTINIDRFYNGPLAAISLLQKGILCRGTVLTSRRFTPSSIRFTQPQANRSVRGSFRMAVSVKEHMSIFGWNDGNGVHMLSTADGTEIGTVTRQIKAVSKVITAPKVVKLYNDGMQGVDRHDQLRTLFSLATRHQFRKYYVTLMMALIDFALVNAYLHYHMAHPLLRRHKEHRAQFMQTLSEELRNANWHTLQTKHYQRSMPRSSKNTESGDDAKQSSRVRNLLGLISQPSDTLEHVGHDLLCRNVSSPNCNPRLCTDLKNQLTKEQSYCQVCQYEGRGRKQTGVSYCYKHCIRACGKVQDDIRSYQNLGFTTSTKTHLKIHSNMDFSLWLCPDTSLTCWEKMHQFYLHRDLFISSTNKEGTLPILRLNRNCSLYKARCDFIKENKWSIAEPKANIPPAIRKSPRRGYKLPSTPLPLVDQKHTAQSPNPQGRHHRSGVITSPSASSTHV